MSSKKINYCSSKEESIIQYKLYISNHTKAVVDCYTKAISAFKEIFPEVYNDIHLTEELLYNLDKHDDSKYNINEFWAYMDRFFPYDNRDPESSICKYNFKLAWLHHAHHNPHHPAYWALADDNELIIYDMPDIYIIEMLCDWMAMSQYYNSTTLEYWKSESAQKLPMSENTKAKVNKFMEWLIKNNMQTLW